MADLRIDRDTVFDAPIDVVWRTITTPDQISQWFADCIEIDLRPGGRGFFVFEQPPPGPSVTAAFVVERVEPPTLFSFRWGLAGGEESATRNSILVEFTLAAEGAERTRLRVVERGLDAIGWPDEDKARYADEHRNGWTRHLGRLRDRLSPAAGASA